MKNVFLFLLFMIVLFSCDLAVTNDDPVMVDDPVYETTWFYNTDFWTVEGNKLTSKGIGTNDSVAWIDRRLEGSFEITFIWKRIDFDVDSNEVIFILLGNKGLIGDFWSDGININIDIDENSTPVWCTSEVRLNGIYDNVEWLNTKYDLPVFENNTEYICKIVFDHKILSFYIDDLEVHKGVITDLDNSGGYFGVANYWGRLNNNEFYNFVITDMD